MSKKPIIPVSKTTPRPRRDIPDPKTPASKASPTSQREPRVAEHASAQSPFSRRESKTQKVLNGPEELHASSIMEIDNLRDRLREAEDSKEESVRDLLTIEASFSALQDAHTKLEEQLLAIQQEKGDQEAELKLANAQLKAIERQSEQDRLKLVQEREELISKQEEMSDSLQRLHERSELSTPHRSSLNISSQGLEKVADGVETKDQANMVFTLQMALSQRDRRIELLEQEADQLEKGMQEVTLTGNPLIKELEDRLDALTKENAALREDIEGYQTLLQDKTMNGEFSQSQFMLSTSSTGKYRSMRGPPNGLDLASELDTLSQTSTSKTEPESVEDVGALSREELEVELLKLQETNKALSLYVNTIVTRVIDTGGFEHVLAKSDADSQPSKAIRHTGLQTPVPVQAPSFLDKTKAVLSGKSILPSSVQSETDSVTPRPISHQVRLSPGSNRHRRTVSASNASVVAKPKSVYSSPSGTAKGLRPLNTGAVADHISTKEAKLLSARFAPAPSPVQRLLGAELPATPEQPATEPIEALLDKKAKRSSWIGWLGPKSEPGQRIVTDEPASTLTSMPRSLFASKNSFNSAKSNEMSENALPAHAEDGNEEGGGKQA